MFEKYVILTRGFKNVADNGQITGFQIKVRITCYRGVYLSMLAGFDVQVDGEAFARDQIKFATGIHSYALGELAGVTDVRWPWGKAASLTIRKTGGLRQGMTITSPASMKARGPYRTGLK